MWANCENFTWERGTNDRTSALIPAAPERFMAQLEAASEAGVNRIVSFMMCGIFEPKQSRYSLGQPDLSARAGEEYMRWMESGRPALRERECAEGVITHCSETRLVDGVVGDENTANPAWVVLPKGEHEISFSLTEGSKDATFSLGTLNYSPEGVRPPSRVALYGSEDGQDYELLEVVQPYVWPNDRHDAWVQTIRFSHNNDSFKYFRLVLTCPSKCYMDEIQN